MAIQYRIVQGVMVYPKSGEPIQAGKLRFYLNKGFGLTATHLISDAPRIVTTAVDGSFSIPLWCDETGLRPIDYIVNVPKESGGEPMIDAEHTGTFSLVPGDGTPIDLPVLLIASSPNPTSVELLYQLIDARIAAGGGGGTIDTTILDGSARGVSGNAVFDALVSKADLVVGKVPAEQLPDFILKFATVAVFPPTGDVRKTYIATTGTNANKQYRWDGAAYVQLSPPVGLSDMQYPAGLVEFTGDATNLDQDTLLQWVHTTIKRNGGTPV